MTKKQKFVIHTPDKVVINPSDQIITEMIQKRRLQQEALKKIMTSIDSKMETTELQPINPEKKRARIKKLFTSGKNSSKKTR